MSDGVNGVDKRIPHYLNLNLNDTVRFTLTPSGAEVWRRYCNETLLEMRQHIADWTPQYTGEETELRLQLWCFIRVFGAPHLWSMTAPSVVVDNVLILETS